MERTVAAVMVEIAVRERCCCGMEVVAVVIVIIGAEMVEVVGRPSQERASSSDSHSRTVGDSAASNPLTFLLLGPKTLSMRMIRCFWPPRVFAELLKGQAWGRPFCRAVGQGGMLREHSRSTLQSGGVTVEQVGPRHNPSGNYLWRVAWCLWPTQEAHEC